jgi:hypothetical protein
MYILLTFNKAVYVFILSVTFHCIQFQFLFSDRVLVNVLRTLTNKAAQIVPHMAPDRGSPLDVWLSGYNTQNLPCTIMGNMLGECHAPDMLKTSFIDVGKIVHAL